MRLSIPTALAAAILAATPLVNAQVTVPAGLVDEPAASASTGNRDTELVAPIVEALNADASLKHSKITVLRDENGPVFLTGVTMTNAQSQRALEIAKSKAGEGNVANVLQTAEMMVIAPEPKQVAVVEPVEAAQ